MTDRDALAALLREIDRQAFSQYTRSYEHKADRLINAGVRPPADPEGLREALYALPTHSHQPPNGADMPLDYVSVRDVEYLLERAALAAAPAPADPTPIADITGIDAIETALIERLRAEGWRPPVDPEGLREAAQRAAAYLDTYRGRTHAVQAARGVLRAALAAAPASLDAWADLLAEAVAFEEWYGTPAMSVNAWVGVDVRSGLYGGWSVEGDPLYDDWDESVMTTASGDTPEAVIADLIRIARDYRKRRDDERAEYAQSEEATP